MLDLSAIPAEVLLARGHYATVRAAHEDEKKELQKLCGQLAAVASQVLRTMQPDNDEIPPSVDELLTNGRRTLDAMEASARRIESFAKQRQEVKQQAWGRN